ncbi:MAG: sporulation protein [Myxococcota bacterium]
MGFFDSIKKGLGLSPGEFELRVQPETLHIGGEVQGSCVLTPHKDLNVFSVRLQLMHAFPDDYGVSILEQVQEEVVLAERVSFSEREPVEYPFYIPLHAHLAPSVGRFAWSLVATAAVQSGSPMHYKLPLKVRMSPVSQGIYDVLASHFGFAFESAGADADGWWIEMKPTGAVKRYYDGLEVAFDESPDTVDLWIKVHDLRPEAIQHFRDAFDPHSGAIELELRTRDYAAGPNHIDHQGLAKLLEPMFKL